jgi:O-antigen/teichoic acid export membrane protein
MDAPRKALSGTKPSAERSGTHAMAQPPSPEPDARPPGAPSRAAVKRAMSWVGAGHVVGQAFWFGSLLFLAALLSPAAIGSVTVGLLMVTAATRLMDAGTRGSIIVARGLTRQQLMTSLASNVSAGLVLSGLIVLLSGPMTRAFAHGTSPLVLAALGLSVVLYAPAIVPLALLEKRFEFRRRASVQAASTVTAGVVSVIAGLLGAGVWALVIRQVLFQALLAILGWAAARRFLPAAERRPGAVRWSRLKRRGAAGFMLFSLTDFTVFNADYLAVGHFTNTTQLGLYSLAFTIAFAPMTQFSAQIGSVLFPAAAASDAETMRGRTIAGVRMTCAVLLPLLPVAWVLAPVVVPAVLGDKWAPMVDPLRILLVVGVAHAVVNVIGESLSGTGNIGFRARVNVAWMAAMLVALVILVRADGIRGAALAHLLLYVPVAAIYCFTGLRLLGAEPRRLARALRGVAGLVGLQAAVTFTAWPVLLDAGVPRAVAGILAVGLGLSASGVVLRSPRGRAALRTA